MTWADIGRVGGGGGVVGENKTQEPILILSHFVANLLSSVQWLNSDCIECPSLCF